MTKLTTWLMSTLRSKCAGNSAGLFRSRQATIKSVIGPRVHEAEHSGGESLQLNPLGT